MKKETPILPDSIEQCHSIILEMADKIHALETLSEKQKHQLLQLMRYRYGQRSDRFDGEQMIL